jgi:ribosome-associated toxin RatA of RatAB toxin-antitoxin module
VQKFEFKTTKVAFLIAFHFKKMISAMVCVNFFAKKAKSVLGGILLRA